MNQPPLPTSRALLTSLIQAIANIPLLPPLADSHKGRPPKSHDRTPQPPQDNPLRRVPPSHRHLITTLHVLFPGLVLPALDLLERGLVARVSLLAHATTPKPSTATNTGDETARQEAAAAAAAAMRRGETTTPRPPATEAAADLSRPGEPGMDHQPAVVISGEEETGAMAHGSVHAPEDPAAAAGTTKRNQGQDQSDGRKQNTFYHVQSTAAAAAAEAAREKRMRRRWRGGGGESEDEVGEVVTMERGKGYIVRLEAWHCTCAGFAFSSVASASAFAGSTEASDDGSGGRGSEEVVSWEERTGMDKDMEWSFGGMSLDGVAVGEGVPVCKHLLACLLTERWSVALGRYVVERRVRREEMAGIVADV